MCLRTPLASALLALVLAGCGDAVADEAGLTVTVRPQGPGGREERREITCGEQARASCDQLRSLTPEDLRPVSDRIACPAVYGGPATARLTGRLAGEPVDARFSLRNGCEISRWERLAWLLGPPPS